MKKSIALLIAIISICLVGCSNSPQRTVEKAVVSYLKKNLNDPKSYEPISFSKIDTVWDYHSEDTMKLNNKKEAIFSKYKDTILIYNLYNQLQSNEELFEVSSRNMSSDSIKLIRSLSGKDIIPYRNTVGRLENIINSLDGQIAKYKNMQPILSSFTIKHKYRANNLYGAKVIDENIFLISTDFKVLSYK